MYKAGKHVGWQLVAIETADIRIGNEVIVSRQGLKAHGVLDLFYIKDRQHC